MTVTSRQVRDDIERRCSAADLAVEVARAEAAKAVADEVDYKRSYAKARLLADHDAELKTVAARDATAELETIDKLRAHLLSRAMAKIALEHVRTTRGHVSAAQTWAGFYKLEFEQAHKGPQVSP